MLELADAYLSGLSLRLSPKSIRAARHVLKALRAHMEALGLAEWGEVDAECLSEWQRSLHRLRSSSLRAYSAWAWRFFRWLLGNGHVLADAATGLRQVRVPSSAIVPPSEEEVALALSSDEIAVRCAARNRAIMELAYSTGLRRSELAGLDLRDGLGEEARVLGKGRKERLVPIGEAARERLREYVAGERAVLVCRHGESDALFLSLHGRRLSSSGISAALRLQMRGRVGPHMLRRACATHMLRAGAPLAVLQKLLGHSCPSTTRLYAAVTPEDLRREMLRHHPGW
jgi:site-specific recombinase XerD